MKFLIVLAVVACASADVSHVIKDESNAPIIRSSYDITPEGSFQYASETGNGIYAQAEGIVKNPNSEYPTLEIKGGNKYTAPNGDVVENTYIANENGYQVSGSHLPIGPEIPEAIARSLAYIAAHPPPPESSNKPFSG